MILNLAEPNPLLVARMRADAAQMIYDGRATPAAQRHLKRCTKYDAPTQTLMIYTCDAGMHASGWWKNPDYDRCLHLSLSFAGVDAASNAFIPLPFDWRMAEKWARAFFGEHCRWLWIEPPCTPEGKARDVYHYRLFCDQSWQPIKPRGEVYSRDWTPSDWKSWSDLHGTADEDGDFGAAIDKGRANPEPSP